MHSDALRFRDVAISNTSTSLKQRSAIAESPRNALCLSVVSFNSTTCRAQSSVISYFHFTFTAAYK